MIASIQGRRSLVLYVFGGVFAVTGVVAGTLAAAASTRDLAVLCSVALAYLALFIWRPAVALLLYIALRPLVDAFVFQDFHGFTLGELWGFGMVVSAAVFLVLESADRQHPLRLPAIPIAFLLVFLVLTITRPGIMTAVSGWTKVASWILVMLVAERISRDRRGQLLCWWAGLGMGAALVVSVGVMIMQNRYGAAFYGDPMRDVSGQLPHPLAIGAVLLMPFALIGVQLAGSRRILSLAIAAGLMGAVILSYVRTAMIGGVIMLLSLLAVTVKSKGKARAAGGAIAVCVILAGYLARDRILARFADLTLLSSSGAAQGGAGSGRLNLWRTTFQAAFDGAQHAIVGRGAGGSEQVMEKALGIFVGAQNDLFDFLLDGGLVLAISYVVLLLWMGWNPVHTLRDPEQSSNVKSFAILTLGAVVAFFAMSMLNGIATYQPSVAIGLLIGLARGVMATPADTFLDTGTTTSGPAG